MINKKLMMFAVAGLAPALYGLANAESQSAAVTVMIPEPVKDLAPVTGNPARLRRTDQEQPGNEMPAYAFFTNADGTQTDGIYFAMTTELNGVGANDRIQLSAVPFSLKQDPATGAVAAVADLTKAKFVTNNNGNERRNANAPTALTANNGSIITVSYNFQPNNGSDTIKYIMAFNRAGDVVLKQTEEFAKNNDDASMQQDGFMGVAVDRGDTAAGHVTQFVKWYGANGNGRDDGWAGVSNLTCNSATAPTSCTFAKQFDISLEPEEERSRGACTVSAADTSYAVCSWTAGDSQPQHRGVWLGAISLDSSIKGADQQQAKLWKMQIAGRINNNPAAATSAKPAGQTTYAQRAIQERIMETSATGALVPSDKILYRYGDAVGRNNNKGTYYTNMLAVIQVAKNQADVKYLVKPVDMTSQFVGLQSTHLGSTMAVFGPNATPGIALLGGSLFGGGAPSMLTMVSLDPTANYVPKTLASMSGGAHDGHLYSNYLGNNPGNQGRNHTAMTTVANPFYGQNGNTSKYLLLAATTAKTTTTTAPGILGTPASKDTMSNPAIKLTALMTVMPLGGMTASNNTPTGSDPTGSDPSGSNSNNGSNNNGSNSSDPGTTLGGCSAAGGSAGLASFLLIGLAAFIRRRR